MARSSVFSIKSIAKEQIISVATKIYIAIKFLFNYIDMVSDLYLIWLVFELTKKDSYWMVNLIIMVLFLLYERKYSLKLLYELYERKLNKEELSGQRKLYCFLMILTYSDIIPFLYDSQTVKPNLLDKKIICGLVSQNVIFLMHSAKILIYKLHMGIRIE